MKIRLTLLLGLFIAVSFVGSAQDYDDIYYNSSKSNKKENTTKKTKSATTTAATSTSTVTQMPYSYTVVSNTGYSTVENGRDVDEYNRRGTSYSVQDTVGYDSLSVAEGQDFVYTDRIRRFYNPSVVVETGSPEVAESYYIATTPNVNIIVGAPTYTYVPYSAWNWSWGWSTWGYDYWSWSPYYSWHAVYHSPWYYDWGWSFGWTWHHHHHHPHHWWAPSYSFHKPIYGGKPHHVTVPSKHYNTGGGRRPFGGGTAISNGSARPNNGTVSGRPNAGRRPVAVDNNGNRVTTNTRSNATVSNNGGRRPAVGTQTEATRTTQNNYGSRPSSSRNTSTVSNNNNYGNKRRTGVGTVNNSSYKSSSSSKSNSSSNNNSNYNSRSNSSSSNHNSSSYRSGFSSSSRNSGSSSGSRGNSGGGGNRRR